METPTPRSPIAVCTEAYSRPLDPVAYDCFRVKFIKSGTAIVMSEFGERSVRQGQIVMLGTNVLCGCEPEGQAQVTTIFLDRNYLIDQVYWQYAAVLADRLEASRFLDTPYIEPVQLLSLRREDVARVELSLDELAELSASDFATDLGGGERFYRMQALLSSVLHIIVPYLEIGAMRRARTQRLTTKLRSARPTRFQPLRQEARRAAQLLESDLTRKWTLAELGREVHLSRSRLATVFTDAFGKSPQTYLAVKRVETMAKLLRETPVSIAQAAEDVGWRNRSHAADMFRRYLGVTPSSYRKRLRARSIDQDRPEKRSPTT